MNILQPITFAHHHEAQKFTRYHVCALCLGELIVDDLAVRCPEHGIAYEHTVTKRSKANQINSNVRVAKIDLEMFGKPRRTEEEILKELGFD